MEYEKCTVCTQIIGKPKILRPKWDTLSKHGDKRKATRNMANGIKKGSGTSPTTATTCDMRGYTLGGTM